MITFIYYIAKLCQASALVLILINFISRYPQLMSPKVLFISIGLFTIGWIVEYSIRKI